MLAINLANLILIELEYIVADISHYTTSAADPSERAILDIQLPKIRAAKAAVELAIEVIRISSDWPEGAEVTLTVFGEVSCAQLDAVTE